MIFCYKDAMRYFRDIYVPTFRGGIEDSISNDLFLLHGLEDEEETGDFETTLQAIFQQSSWKVDDDVYFHKHELNKIVCRNNFLYFLNTQQLCQMTGLLVLFSGKFGALASSDCTDVFSLMPSPTQ